MLALLCFVLTVVIYGAAKKLYRRVPIMILTPLLTVPAAVIVIVVIFHIPFERALRTQRISCMIGPATVALAVPLYKNIEIL